MHSIKDSTQADRDLLHVSIPEVKTNLENFKIGMLLSNQSII